MKNYSCYFEKRILFNEDAQLSALRLEKIFTHYEYCLYEMPGEISVGLDPEIQIIVSKMNIEVLGKGYNSTIKINGDLSEALDKAFENINIQNWRSYGIAMFDIARLNHGLIVDDEEILMRAFIPRIEFRIKNHEVIIRTLDSEQLDHIYEIASNLLLKKDTSVFDSGEKTFDNGYLMEEKKEDYEAAVKSAVNEIKNGKYKKVIISRELELPVRLDMLKSYFKGRRLNTPARSYIYSENNFEVIGFSPETVVEVDKNNNVSTLPLAGTRALTCDPEKNGKLKDELLTDTKEIAEHAISVKLAFEELSKICEPKSVFCGQFMEIMERGTVQHLGSRVSGKLAPKYKSWHAFNVLFPAITASGIPKKEAIEAIGRLEEKPRGLYSGSVFIYEESQRLDAALVLRTIFQDVSKTWVRVGAGVVEMSKSEREFEETCEKLSSFSAAMVMKEDGNVYKS